ncbi:MAG: BON domain-containing protein [Candidatus Solibacter usitatus]|nr:BON domain-containing protein [Candidatus Solibacter usitatus]
MKISVVASALLIAIAAQAGPDAKPAPSTQRSSSQPVSSDAQIEKAIRARFAESKISANKFQVRVQGGVATLEGKTEVLQHKGTATRLAKSAGAVRVINRIEVSDAAKQKAASNLATGRRRAQIKRGEVTGRR